MNGGRRVTKETCLYAEDYAFSVARAHTAAQDLPRVQVSACWNFALRLTTLSLKEEGFLGWKEGASRRGRGGGATEAAVLGAQSCVPLWTRIPT